MAEAYEGFHLSHDDALALAQWSDDTMATCILDLYRSATPNVFASWGAQLAPTSAPGLILLAALDTFGNEAMSKEVARTLGARRSDAAGSWALVGSRSTARSGRRNRGIHSLG